MGSPTSLLEINVLDTQGIHDLIIQTEWTGMLLLVQAALKETKIMRIIVKIVITQVITVAIPQGEGLIMVQIAWVITQVTPAMITHRLIALIKPIVPNPRIRIPQHLHQQMRIGMIDVIDHIGVTVVIALGLLTDTVANSAVLSEGSRRPLGFSEFRRRRPFEKFISPTP
jgi:hypothetical protein